MSIHLADLAALQACDSPDKDFAHQIMGGTSHDHCRQVRRPTRTSQRGRLRLLSASASTCSSCSASRGRSYPALAMHMVACWVSQPFSAASQMQTASQIRYGIPILSSIPTGMKAVVRRLHRYHVYLTGKALTVIFCPSVTQ